MIEIWRPVPGYGGHYEASSEGRIRSLDRVVMKHCPGIGKGLLAQRYKGRLLKPSKSDKWGHLSVHLGVNGKKHSVAVHRLVLLAFKGEPGPGQEGCHDNGVAGDNRIANLRWDTHAANNKDRLLHGTYAVGEAHAMAKITEEVAREIRSKRIHYEAAAGQFGISRSQAYRIYRGQSWSHLS